MLPSPSHFDVIVLGGGAAGLMCAIEAGKRGRQVAVLEHANRIGKKILISGGGRCNFTNLHCTPANFLSHNPHFAKSALARYTPEYFVAMVERHGISYHEKTLGQLFCDRSARDIVNMLEAECRAADVRIFVNTQVVEVRRESGFVVRTNDAEFDSAALVVATGGLSIPKMGASGFGYDLARQFGLRVRECRPALVPLMLNAEDCARYCDLAGVSMEVVASCADQHFREKMLVTHRGLSGPAILQATSYWEPPQGISIDLAPNGTVVGSLQSRTPDALRSALRTFLPNRFADRWLELHMPSRWTNTALTDWEQALHTWTIQPSGTEGFEKAEVTAGGVDTDELSAKTMGAQKVPGLYFVGEVVDVTGHLGGFNFQWAWASGFCAGEAIGMRVGP